MRRRIATRLAWVLGITLLICSGCGDMSAADLQGFAVAETLDGEGVIAEDVVSVGDGFSADQALGQGASDGATRVETDAVDAVDAMDAVDEVAAEDSMTAGDVFFGETAADIDDADDSDATGSDEVDVSADMDIEAGDAELDAGGAGDGGAAIDVDTDNDGLPDVVELWLGTNPNKSDTDGDGLLDGEEVNPANGTKTNPNKTDTDGDGLTDGVEIKISKTDPNKADSDGDGLSDGEEVDVHGTNPLKADTDGDGLSDGLEVGKAGDADPTTKTDPTKADSDGDGQLDGEEDINRNGKIDMDESDPNDPSSVLVALGSGGTVCTKNSECDDANDCTDDACTKSTCKFVNAATATTCSTASSWTIGACNGGACVAKAKAACPDFVLVPAGVISANADFGLPQLEIKKFWLARRPALGSDYLACLASKNCPIDPILKYDKNYFDTPSVPYDVKKCMTTTCTLQSDPKSPNKCSGPFGFWCGDPGAKCSTRANEPYVSKTLETSSAYCEWLGGRLPTKAEIYHASMGGCENPIKLEDWPAKELTWHRLCGVAPQMMYGIQESFEKAQGECKVDYSSYKWNCTSTLCGTRTVSNSPTGVWPVEPKGVYASYPALQSTAMSGGGGTGHIYCAFDTKPTCN